MASSLNRPVKSCSSRTLTYAQWSLALDKVLVNKIGCTLDEMPDLTCTRDLFDDGLTAAETALIVVEDQGADGWDF